MCIFNTKIFLVLILISFSFLSKKCNAILQCEYDEDCNENAVCDIMKKCKCKKGFTETITYDCVPTKIVGDPCDDDLECWQSMNELSICSEGKCKCGSEANTVDGICYIKSRLDEVCFSDENCIAENGISPKCDNSGVCKCSKNQMPSEDHTSCLNIKNLGDSCSTETDICIDENSVCNTVCGCDDTHIISRNNTACLKKAEKLGDPCTEDAQCSKFENSSCDNNKCACKKNFVNVNNQCKENSGRGIPPVEVDKCSSGTNDDVSCKKNPETAAVTEEPNLKENDATSLSYNIVPFIAIFHIVYSYLY